MAMLFLHDSAWDQEKDKIKEMGYWLSMSVLLLLGVCLVSHQDSRYYRYPLAVFSFAAVYGWYFLLVKLWRVPSLLAVLILLIYAGASMANEGFKVALYQGGDEDYPTIKENMAVLKGQLQTEEALKQRYPKIEQVLQLVKSDPEKFKRSAWDMDGSFQENIPQFWLPSRPVASLWMSNLINWNSYGDLKKIIQDFHGHNIDWVIAVGMDGRWSFIPVEAYASRLTAQMRFPTHKFSAYTGIPELDNLN
jgi:uncharacterized membrane protein